MERFWSKVDRSGGPDACWPWTASTKKPGGYGQFNLDGRIVNAHWLAFVLTFGGPENWVLHTCHNPPCCNPGHLYDGTHAENCQDKVESGRSLKGAKNPSAKLTEDQVREVRGLVADGASQRNVAAAFGVSRGAVQGIVELRRWGWLS